MTYIRGMGHWALSGNQGAMAKIIKGRRGVTVFLHFRQGGLG